MDRCNTNVQDATLRETKALGTADGTVTTTGFNTLARGSRDAWLNEMELVIEAPALNTTQLPDADTNTYSVEMDTVSNFATPTTIADKVIVQTGAGGAGAAAVTRRFKLPSDVEQYVRVKSILAGGTGDCSGASMVVSLRGAA